MKKNIILNIAVSSLITCVLTFLLMSTNQKSINPIKELFAQAGTSKALLLILGNTCPPGFKTPEAAGLNAADWYGRFPMLAQMPDSDVNGVMDVGGSNAALASGSHQHTGTADAVVPSWPTSGSNAVGVTSTHGHTLTINSNGSHTHTLDNYRVLLKPCIWSMN